MTKATKSHLVMFYVVIQKKYVYMCPVWATVLLLGHYIVWGIMEVILYHGTTKVEV